MHFQELETTTGCFHVHSEGFFYDADRSNEIGPVILVRHFQIDPWCNLAYLSLHKMPLEKGWPSVVPCVMLPLV